MLPLYVQLLRVRLIRKTFPEASTCKTKLVAGSRTPMEVIFLQFFFIVIYNTRTFAWITIKVLHSDADKIIDGNSNCPLLPEHVRDRKTSTQSIA